MLRLYQSLVRPKLKYCIQRRQPYSQQDMDLFKKVQKELLNWCKEINLQDIMRDYDYQGATVRTLRTLFFFRKRRPTVGLRVRYFATTVSLRWPHYNDENKLCVSYSFTTKVHKSQHLIIMCHWFSQTQTIQESHAVAGKPRDTAVNSDRYRVRWHFAGAISVSRMQSVSGCTVYA